MVLAFLYVVDTYIVSYILVDEVSTVDIMVLVVAMVASVSLITNETNSWLSSHIEQRKHI